MAETTPNKDRLKEITASIESGIQDLFQSEKYAQYLRTMSRFHKYSVNNTMLIYMQKPDATLVAGFNKWKDQFERNVVKGEKGIKIIAPTPFKKKIEETKLDPDTKLPVLDADGKVVTEEKEVKIPMYKVVSVFDVAQTQGKPLPTLAADLAGNVQNYDVFMEALKRSAPVPITIETMAANMDGYFDTENQRIAIREGMSEVQTVSATVHEIAHSKLHNRVKAQEEAIAEDETGAPVKPKSRETEEVEAESISYAVCTYYGIATGENSFGYIATWSKGKELSELRASLETINKTSSGLISDIDRNYAEIMKERGLDKEVAAEQVINRPATEAPIPPTPEYEYKLHANPRSTGIDDAAFIQAYQRTDEGLVPGDVVGYGNYDALIPLTNKLNGEKTAPDAVAEMIESENAQRSPVEPEIPAPELGVEEAPAQTAPENGYLPDPAMSIEAMNAYGYTDADMLPLSKERAIELFERDLTVYMLYDDNTEAMAFDTDEIRTFEGMFGVSRGDWEFARDSIPTVDAASQEQSQPDLEKAFLESTGDAYLIYQLADTPANAEYRFMGADYLEKNGIVIEPDRYDAINLGDLQYAGVTQDKLNGIYQTFNINHPDDFEGHSLSVSDIVVLKQDGKVSCHYVDSWGFKELPTFLKLENYLKNAEMAMEDDYGMIDGIVNNGPKQPTVAELEAQAKSGQPISLMDLAEAVHRERDTDRKEKKPSLLAQIRNQPERDKTTKKAPHKSAERELI